MTLQDTRAPAPPEGVSDEGLRSLRNAGLLDGPRCEEVDRWIVALRRQTGAPVAGLRLVGDAGLATRLIATEEGIATPAEAAWAVALLEEATGAPVGEDGRDALEAPVRVDAQLLGTVVVADPRRRAWTNEDFQALEDAASAVSTEVALRLARREAERAQQLIVSHAKVHDLIASAAPLPEVLAAVVESVERHEPSVLACVVLLDPASSTLHPGAGPSLPAAYLAAIDGVVIGPNVGTCGTAAWSGELVVTADIASDPKWAPIRHVPAEAGLASCWSMPIKAPGGEVLGTLAFYGRAPRQPLPEQLGLLRDWARVAGIAIERHRATERLVHDARHDSLTGLANRMATMEALEEAVRRAGPDAPVAVLFVDLDGLKHLNDTLGHDRADEMLREVSARLSAKVPSGAVVGRFGGDEFVVVAEGLRTKAGAEALAVELLEAVAAPLPGNDLVVTASIGIALGVDDTTDAAELLREADSAMYAAKRSGRDRCAFYEGGQRVRSGRRVRLQRELRGAETRGELRLCYERLVELESEEVVGVEAAPVWDSPSHGEVRAAELMKVAGEVGAIVPIGAWVLRESCEVVAGLSERLGRPLALAVDVSLRQLESPGFAETVRQVLVHSCLPADQLWLEVDEAELARPGAVALQALEALSRLRVHLVLDHAGGSLCSPAGLRDLPVDAMKLDERLTAALPTDPKQEAIATAVVTIADAFGLTISAQGIQREEQRARLVQLGIRLGQGPRFGTVARRDGLAGLLSGVRPAAG